MPIKTQWTREEDMVQGGYHPVTMAKMTGGLDAQGNLVGLHMSISGQSILSMSSPHRAAERRPRSRAVPGAQRRGNDSQIGYSFPNLLIDHAMRNTPCPRISGAA